MAGDWAGDLLAPGVNSIVKIAPTGSVTNIPLLNVSAVTGITVDSAGNLYLSDVGNHNQIVKVFPDGHSASLAGTNGIGFGGDGGPALQATLFDPVGLAVDASDNLLIADNLNGRVRKVFTSAGSNPVITSINTSGGSPDIAQN